MASFEPYRQLDRLLDVGGGSGHLLEAARSAGWGTDAIEYGPRQRDRLATLRHNVHPPLLEAQELEDAQFDVVVLQEVLEHLREPARELREAARLLRLGGLLYVTCPNFASLSRRVLGSRWRVVEYPEHLSYFTPSTLNALLTKSGFRAVSVTTAGLSVTDLFAWLRAPSPASPRDRSLDERIRAGAEHRAAIGALKRTANAMLASGQLGDTIKGRYERR